MAEYIYALMLTYLAFIFAVLSPGPNVLGVLSTSTENGRTAGVLFGFGIAFGSLTWASLSVLGLTQFIARFGNFLFIIKIFGGAYLLYLGYAALIASKGGSELKIEYNNRYRARTFFLHGYLLMMTNPKAVLAWVAIVSLSTFNGAPSWVPIAAIFGTFLLSVLIHTILAFVFSNNSFVKYYSKSRGLILKAFAIVYGGLGVKLLTSNN